MLDGNQYGWVPNLENNNWSCYYYPDGLPLVSNNPSVSIMGSGSFFKTKNSNLLFERGRNFNGNEVIFHITNTKHAGGNPYVYF